MGVKEKKTVYETSDGREFTTKEQAEKYEALLTAKRKFDSASEELAKLLLGSQKTKDGEPFQFRVWRSYWVLRNYCGQRPYVEEVRPHFHEIYLDEDCEASFCMKISGYDDRRVHNHERVLKTYRVSELYASEPKATRALIEALREYQTDIGSQIERIEERVQD